MKLLEYEKWEDQRNYLWDIYSIQMSDMGQVVNVNHQRELATKKRKQKLFSFHDYEKTSVFDAPCSLSKVCSGFESYKCSSGFRDTCRELNNSFLRDGDKR